MSSLLIIVLMLCAALMAVMLGISVYMFMRAQTPEPSPIKERLSRVKTMGDREVAMMRGTGRDIASLFKNSLYSNALIEGYLEKFSFISWLKKILIQSGSKQPVDKFVINALIIPPVITTILGLITKFPPLILLGLLIAGGQIGMKLFKRKKRFDKLVQQLPDALSVMVSALRAGHSFQSAISLVVNEMQDPIAGELRQVVSDLSLGLPIKEAFAKLLASLEGLTDYHMFATAILIQRETGGNLAEILESLAKTIRERFKLKGQIAAMTGQAQATGFMVGAAPIVMLLLMTMFFYSYVEPLYTHPLGKMALLFGLILQGIGFFVIHKILQIKF